jgi:hypothetical protein
MWRAGSLILYSLVCFVSLSSVSQLWDAGHGGVALAQQDRYIIAYYRSQLAGIIQATTVVSITNYAPGSCNVSVTWFSLSNTSDCQTTTSIAPLETHQHCSNALDPAIGECVVTCGDDNVSGILNSHEGRAVITLNDGLNCLDNLVVDSRVYYTERLASGYSQVRSILSPRITLIPIGTSDLLGRGESPGVGNKGD